MHAGGGFFAAGYAGDERLELPGEWLTAAAQGYEILPWNESWNCRSLIPAPPMDKVDCGIFDHDWLTSEVFCTYLHLYGLQYFQILSGTIEDESIIISG